MKETIRATRHYLDENEKWYINEEILPGGKCEYWLGHEDYGVRKFLFAHYSEPLLTELTAAEYREEIEDFHTWHCDRNTELPNFN